MKYRKNETTFHRQLVDEEDDDALATSYDIKMANFMMEEEFDTIELSEHGSKHNPMKNNVYQSKTTPKHTSIFAATKRILNPPSNVDHDDHEDIVNIKLFGHKQDVMDLTEQDGHVMRPVFYVSTSSSTTNNTKFAALCNFFYLTAKYLSCNFCSCCRSNQHEFERLDE